MDKKEQQKQLKDRIEPVKKKYKEVEDKLVQGQRALESLNARRASLVAELAEADAATAGWAESEIDKLDREITRERRMFEGNEALHGKTNAELASLYSELVEVERAIKQKEREQAYAAWQSEFQQRLRTTDEALTASRSGLGALNLLAEQGSREFKGLAIEFMEPLLDGFFVSQANSESRGWRTATPAYRPMSVTVHSQVRK